MVDKNNLINLYTDLEEYKKTTIDIDHFIKQFDMYMDVFYDLINQIKDFKMFLNVNFNLIKEILELKYYQIDLVNIIDLQNSYLFDQIYKYKKNQSEKHKFLIKDFIDEYLNKKYDESYKTYQQLMIIIDKFEKNKNVDYEDLIFIFNLLFKDKYYKKIQFYQQNIKNLNKIKNNKLNKQSIILNNIEFKENDYIEIYRVTNFYLKGKIIYKNNIFYLKEEYKGLIELDSLIDELKSENKDNYIKLIKIDENKIKKQFILNAFGLPNKTIENVVSFFKDYLNKNIIIFIKDYDYGLVENLNGKIILNINNIENDFVLKQEFENNSNIKEDIILIILKTISKNKHVTINNEEFN